MSILYIDQAAHKKISRTYSYYNGLYDAFCWLEHPLVMGIDKTKGAIDVIKNTKVVVDAIYFGIGFFRQGECAYNTNEFGNYAFPKICHIFKPQNHFDEKLRFCINNKVDLIISSIPSYKKFEKETGVRAERMMYAADKNVFYDRKVKKIYDIGFSGALHDAKHYPKGAFAAPDMRRRLQELIKKQPVKSLLNGSDELKDRIMKYNDYAEKIAQSKIWIATPAPFGDVTPRYFEIPLSNTLLMCSEVHDTYKDVFIDGENCVMFKNDLSDFVDKMNYYLEHDDKRQEIANRAYVEFHVKHSWENRAKQLLGYMEELCQK